MSIVQQGPIRLWRSNQEQELYDSKADLYAIMKTTEKLERAYVKGAIKPEQYEQACYGLISQFRVLKRSLAQVVPDVERFMVEYNMQCPLAATRLIHSGLPATVEHQPRQTGDPEAASVAATVQGFITAMDAIKLKMLAVDQICPLLLDIITGLDTIRRLPPNFPPREKMKEWYSQLHQKPANYVLPETESRQLMYDIEVAYNKFMQQLKSS
ncbi:subunit of the ESCRT-I complex [Haematococcus lacustris]|nr:hypothetical protein QJQ45_013438 [Haematococcus lacustris]